MKKRILAALLCLSLTAGLAVPAYAEEAPEETGLTEETTAEVKEDVKEPEPLDALEAEPAALEARHFSDWVTYPVTGGNLYFDPTTGEIANCDERVTRAVIPSEINGVRVTSIGYPAFCRCSGLTSVTIPNSVTSIGEYAFEYCSSLTSVTIPSSVTSIGSFAFSNCSGLTSVSIPNSVISIGNSAFSGCSGLTSVTIPSSITSIGISVFAGCGGLTSVTIPDGVTSIGEAAFQVCEGLTSVSIPNSVTSIGDYAFYYCKGLTSVSIPNSVTSIGNHTFDYCTGLISVTIPDSVTSIGDSAFNFCDNLTDVYYTGTKSQWDAISTGSDNDPLTSAAIHYNSDGPVDSVEAKLISASAASSTVQLTGGTLPGDARVFAARQAGGRFAGAALGTRSGDQVTFHCLLAEGDKLFFLSEDFIPLAPAVRIAA